MCALFLSVERRGSGQQMINKVHDLNRFALSITFPLFLSGMEKRENVYSCTTQ